MKNYTKKTKKEQRTKKERFSSCEDIRIATHEKLDSEENDINKKKIELGYGNLSWEEFLDIPIESLAQAKASEVISLLESYESFLVNKQLFENTIYLEPSKLPESVDEAEKLLLKQQDHIYQRSGKLIRVIKISNSPSNKNIIIKRSNDAIVIKEIDQAFLTVYLTKIGNFVIFDARSGSLKKIDCPEKISRYLIAKQEWKVSVLTGIINAPTLRCDGSVLDSPGYDISSGLLFFSGDYTFAKILQNPTLEDAKKAKDELLYILKDFPFEDEASKSVVLSAILTVLVRKSISTAPLFGFTAPKMASGKSLLADVIALIGTGKTNSVIAQSENETEEKKRIMAVLIEGDPIVCYDNIEKPFKSASLCSILTQHEYKDRLLGGNETRTVLTNATFLVTGNNLTFMGDLSTRSLLCKLDPKLEHPEERSFALDLRKYIPQNRSSLVKAGLTILRAYSVAGKPSQKIKPFGRFEEWSDWIRSAIVWTDMVDPCKTRKEIENSDPIRILLSSLFTAWHEIFGEQSIKVRQLLDDSTISKNSSNPEVKETLQEALLELAIDRKGNINQRSLAKKFAFYKNRIENGFRLEQNGSHQGTFLWRIRKISE